ncbi:MAG: hypothetical protein V3R57_02225 [Candidatus Bathyarchaeia archaeon]
MAKRKINRPNLSQWEIRSRHGNYAKHERCGGLIASRARDGETLLFAPLSRHIFTCLECKQKVGKRSKASLIENTHPVMEHIHGVGIRNIFHFPEPEEETERLVPPGRGPRAFIAACQSLENVGRANPPRYKSGRKKIKYRAIRD